MVYTTKLFSSISNSTLWQTIKSTQKVKHSNKDVLNKINNSIIFATSLLSLSTNVFSASSQILNDYFYQNPAELSVVNQMQLMSGNIYVVPKFKFTGESAGTSGSTTSKVNNNLPYLLSAYRINDRLVMGIDITPSSYGHLEWPVDSFVDLSSTNTNVIYYRAGVQSSYQVTDKLAIGLGLNLEYNKQLEVDFVIPNIGNQINKVSAVNYSADIGVLYKINTKTSLTAAIYSPVNAYGYGTSSTATTTVNNFSSNITEASVAFIGIQHKFTDKWFWEEKLYWSGWSLQKNIYFTNTTTGSFITPTNWRDVISIQSSTRYQATERFSLLGSLLYETNPVSPITNQVGYPLAATGFISAGLDIALTSGLSTQILYGYGTFIPNAEINNSSGIGFVSANIQSIVLQFIYQI